MKKRKRSGRPTRYTRALAKRICREVAKGSTREGAAALAGVSLRALYEWRVAIPEFADALQKADAQFQKAALANISKAGRRPRNWAANAWLLERKYPREFSRTDRHVIKSDAPPMALPEEYKKAISEALGYTGVVIPLKASDLQGRGAEPPALPPAPAKDGPVIDIPEGWDIDEILPA